MAANAGTETTHVLIICQFLVRRKPFSLLADIDFFLKPPSRSIAGVSPLRSLRPNSYQDKDCNSLYHCLSRVPRFSLALSRFNAGNFSKISSSDRSDFQPWPAKTVELLLLIKNNIFVKPPKYLSSIQGRAQKRKEPGWQIRSLTDLASCFTKS
jgi:hypothetical protein